MHVMHGPSSSSSYWTTIDVVDELRGGSPRLNARVCPRESDQRDAGTVDTGDGLRRELGHVAEQVDHSARAGHQPGHAAQPGVQVDLVGLHAVRRQIGLRGVATGLRVVISHRDVTKYPPARRRTRPVQSHE